MISTFFTEMQKCVARRPSEEASRSHATWWHDLSVVYYLGRQTWRLVSGILAERSERWLDGLAGSLRGFASREQDWKKYLRSQASFDGHTRKFRLVGRDVIYGQD